MALFKVPITEVPLKAFIIVAVTYWLRLASSTAPAPVGTPRAVCRTSTTSISKETLQPLGSLCWCSITMQHRSAPGAQTEPFVLQFVPIASHPGTGYQ